MIWVFLFDCLDFAFLGYVYCSWFEFLWWSLVGGAKIQIYNYYDYLLSEEYMGYCTVGYAAILNGKKGYVTSGHCFDGTVGDLNEPHM